MLIMNQQLGGSFFVCLPPDTADVYIQEMAGAACSHSSRPGSGTARRATADSEFHTSSHWRLMETPNAGIAETSCIYKLATLDFTHICIDRILHHDSYARQLDSPSTAPDRARTGHA